MTVYFVLYVRAYSRDVPFMDEFDMVPVLTGAAPVTPITLTMGERSALPAHTPVTICGV